MFLFLIMLIFLCLDTQAQAEYSEYELCVYQMYSYKILEYIKFSNKAIDSKFNLSSIIITVIKQNTNPSSIFLCHMKGLYQVQMPQPWIMVFKKHILWQSRQLGWLEEGTISNICLGQNSMLPWLLPGYSLWLIICWKALIHSPIPMLEVNVSWFIFAHS